MPQLIIARCPRSEGYVAGYRIPKRLDQQLKELGQREGYSKLHLLELALHQFLAKTKPLEW
jgi:hypothetical protein